MVAKRLNRNSWLIDGVFVDIKGLGLAGVDKGACMFWIGIDHAKHVSNDIMQVANQIIADNEDLGISRFFPMDYIDSMNLIGKGLQHKGLLFSWQGILTENCDDLDDRRKHFEETERRVLDSIGRLVAQLKSKGIPLSEQHPYSAKNTWLNHFRPTIEHLMSLGTNFWLPALTLSIPCIDAAYQDACNITGRSDARRMLRWFLDPNKTRRQDKKLDKTIDLLAKGFANGLKHDTLVKDPIVLEHPHFKNLLSKPKFTVHIDEEETSPIFSVCVDDRDEERILVSPLLWWVAVRDKLNRYYNLSS